MKQLFTLLLLSIALTSCSTFIPTEVENGKLLGVLPMQYERGSYQLTKEVRGSREEIFRQTRKWAAFHMRDPKQSLSVSDNLLGDVIISGRIAKQTVKGKNGPVNMPGVNYSISIEAFTNSYRVTLTNFQFETTPIVSYPVEIRPSGISRAVVRRQFQVIDDNVQSLLKDLNEFVPLEIVRQR